MVRTATILDMSILKRIIVDGKSFNFRGHIFDTDKEGNPVVDDKVYSDGNWEQALMDYEHLVFPDFIEDSEKFQKQQGENNV